MRARLILFCIVALLFSSYNKVNQENLKDQHQKKEAKENPYQENAYDYFQQKFFEFFVWCPICDIFSTQRSNDEKSRVSSRQNQQELLQANSKNVTKIAINNTSATKTNRNNINQVVKTNDTKTDRRALSSTTIDQSTSDQIANYADPSPSHVNNISESSKNIHSVDSCLKDQDELKINTPSDETTIELLATIDEIINSSSKNELNSGKILVTQAKGSSNAHQKLKTNEKQILSSNDQEWVDFSHALRSNSAFRSGNLDQKTLSQLLNENGLTYIDQKNSQTKADKVMQGTLYFAQSLFLPKFSEENNRLVPYTKHSQKDKILSGKIYATNLKPIERDADKFIRDEVANLLIPDDDVVLGEIILSARLLLMNNSEYTKYFWIDFARREEEYAKVKMNNYIANITRDHQSPTLAEARDIATDATLKEDIELLRFAIDHSEEELVNYTTSDFNLLALASASSKANSVRYLLLRGASPENIYLRDYKNYEEFSSVSPRIRCIIKNADLSLNPADQRYIRPENIY
ncbi:MAG: hypothetical protein SFT93_03820 [Rickettsiaceae bacterium]|nr:hypothetical protein [Rickettsiaceae bacterium]